MMSERKQAYVEVAPGVEIYYEEAGSGPPMLFVPGWTFTTEMFQHQLKHFSAHRRVIIIDPRSHGRSTITSHGNNYATHGTDLLHVIKALDLKELVLVGWSFGCLAVWEYINQAGISNVKGVVSVDLPPKPLSVNDKDWVEGSLDDMAGAYTAYMGSPAQHREFVKIYATQVMVQRDLTAAELRWITDQSLKTPYYIAGQLFASGLFSNCTQAAKLVDEKVPALNIVAEHWSQVATTFTNKHFPNTNIATLGGHMMFWEHHEKFNKLLADFIDKL
ncbi:hypothetical protein COTS27_01417 [Spirochaetota bacterium]|nr:hypothetical protein COTS27_01417 [Spirochaetota bacterium]